MQPWYFIRTTDQVLRQRIYQRVKQERIATAEVHGKRHEEFIRLKVEGILECGELLIVSLMEWHDERIFGRRTLPQMDLAPASCAIQNLWLTARTEGIGMGWVSLFDPDELGRLLQAPEGG